MLLKGWMAAQPDVAEGLDTQVCEGKTLRGIYLLSSRISEELDIHVRSPDKILKADTAGCAAD